MTGTRATLFVMVSLPEPEHQEDGEDAFSFSLPFAAEVCETCGTAAEEGPCPNCGTFVAASAEVLPVTRARISALAPLLSDVAAIEAAFGQIQFGAVPVSADQFNRVVLDLGFYGHLSAIVAIPRGIQNLNFEDPQAIGGSARAAVGGYVRDVRALLGMATELARFAPEGPGRRVQELTLEAGSWGAGTVRSILAALVAPTVAEARRAAEVMQGYLDGSPAVREVEVVLEDVRAAARPDTDSRLELVLGVPGPFTDELGFVDLSRVFGAFASEENPIGVLDGVCRRYFADYVDQTQMDPGASVLLVLPLVALASVDSPLLPHRVAREMVESLRASADRDPAFVGDVLHSTGKDAALVIGAGSRALKGLRLLAMGEASGWVDDEVALMQVMNAYRELVEGPFRTYGWAALRTHAFPTAEALGGAPPMLAELLDRLRASGSSLPQTLGSVVDAQLRNAASHAQYSWDSEASEVEDLRTGQRWSLDDLEASVDGLVGTVIGLDAGIACYASNREVAASFGSSVELADLGNLLEVLLAALFAAQGYELLEISRDLSTAVLNTERLVLVTAVPVVGGIAALPGLTAERIALMSPTGNLLLDVAVEDLRSAATEAEDIRDLRLAVLCAQVERHPRGGDEFTALLFALVAVPALTEAADGSVTDAYLPRLMRRLSYVDAIPAVGTSSGRTLLRGAISAAYAFRAGKRAAARLLIVRLVRMARWADENGVRGFD